MLDGAGFAMARKARRRKTDNPRKCLSADGLLILVREGFGRIRDDRPPDADISLPDALMLSLIHISEPTRPY